MEWLPYYYLRGLSHSPTMGINLLYEALSALLAILFLRHSRRLAYLLCGGSCLFLSLVWGPLENPVGLTYYVDCVDGNDQRTGLSTAQAWRSMSKANSAPLLPGDRLFFKRGCTWNERLDARWSGTATKPITIGAYGQGTLPLIQNGLNQNVKITGSYQIIEYLRVRSDAPATDPLCNNQPIGWTKGFNFLEGSHHNTLRYSEASNLTAGVRIASTSHHNQILYNNLHDNNVMERFSSTTPASDLGAWGIVLNGNDNEIAYNQFTNNNALCSYGTIVHGNSVEIYSGQNNNIHHNRTVGDRVFSELGGGPNALADNNMFAFNLHVSDRPNTRFIVVRGANDSYGPTERTRVFNNTVYFTHATSQGIICGGGCSSTILTLKNNILWAEEKAIYADARFEESNNIYWRADGTPLVQFKGFAMNKSSQIANPRFTNPATRDFHIGTTSPAIDRGAPAPLNWGYTFDLDGITIPQRTAVDVGAYELR